MNMSFVVFCWAFVAAIGLHNLEEALTAGLVERRRAGA